MLTENQIQIIISTMQSYSPTSIGVFGSMARGDTKENSDIDILYQFKETIGLFKLIKLQQDLEKKLNKKVDLVSRKYINPKLKSYIMSDLKIIYENE